MDTKSKSDYSVVWSVIAIGIALVSIGYCFSHILELMTSSMDRSGQAIAHLTRLIRGGSL